MANFLYALSIANYRGIGLDGQKMSGFKKFNFFIGANNSGKSTVLSFIKQYLPVKRMRTGSATISSLEYNLRNARLPISFEVGISLEDAFEKVIDRYVNEISELNMREKIKLILQAMSDENGVIWKGAALPVDGKLTVRNADLSSIRGLLTHSDWQRLWIRITGQNGGGIEHHWVPQTVTAIDTALDVELPSTRLIPAIRDVNFKEGSFEDYNGAGLIDQLAMLQNPEHDKRELREKFDNINKFLRSVTGKSSAEIEIPHSRHHILVHMDGRTLPLSSLGTGIHEVIMIAAFCTLTDEQIVCIEEPEIHLHPLLQRKLMRYLAENTTNQYFIATHSASFIDQPGSAIFHVSLNDNQTIVRKAELKRDIFAICVDLGYRASDIVQANSIIWVEGPSDRIYINHWIMLVASDLVEGIHYSIMFYGGRLLSHLTGDDEAVADFIKLKSLNRHVAIVIDSDKSEQFARINKTKSRIVQEFSSGGSVAWVTKGREIENYIDHKRLQAAVAEVVGKTYGSPVPATIYDHPLFFYRTSPKRSRSMAKNFKMIEENIDKVKVSKVVARDGQKSDLDILDLQKRVEQVVAMIRLANRDE